MLGLGIKFGVENALFNESTHKYRNTGVLVLVCVCLMTEKNAQLTLYSVFLGKMFSKLAAVDLK